MIQVFACEILSRKLPEVPLLQRRASDSKYDSIIEKFTAFLKNERLGWLRCLTPLVGIRTKVTKGCRNGAGRRMYRRRRSCYSNLRVWSNSEVLVLVFDFFFPTKSLLSLQFSSHPASHPIFPGSHGCGAGRFQLLRFQQDWRVDATGLHAHLAGLQSGRSAFAASKEGLGRLVTCCGGVNSTEHGSTIASRNPTAICTWKHLYSIDSIIWASEQTGFSAFAGASHCRRLARFHQATGVLPRGRKPKPAGWKRKIIMFRFHVAAEMFLRMDYLGPWTSWPSWGRGPKTLFRPTAVCCLLFGLVRFVVFLSGKWRRQMFFEVQCMEPNNYRVPVAKEKRTESSLGWYLHGWAWMIAGLVLEIVRSNLCEAAKPARAKDEEKWSICCLFMFVQLLLYMLINFLYIYIYIFFFLFDHWPQGWAGADGGSESLLILSVSNLFFGFLLARRQMLVFGYDGSAGGRT